MMERRMVERQKKNDSKTKEEWKEGKNGGQMKAGRWKEEWNDKGMMNRRMMERKKKDKKDGKRMDRLEKEYGEKKTKEKDILYY